MFTDLIKKKRRLLRWISADRYDKLVEFVSDICLADVDLIILIARKCSNLCMAMLPFALAENGGCLEYMLEKKYKSGHRKRKIPMVMTDRALHLQRDRIEAGEFKKILVVDDLIIHGRTLEEKCYDIEKLFALCGRKPQDYQVETWAFAKCANGLIDSAFVRNCKSWLTCYADDWKSVSDDIVSILHICNVAYTSYVPNMKISMDSEAGKVLGEAISNSRMFRPYGGYDYEFFGDEAYVCVNETSSDAVWSSSIRIYSYPELNSYMFIPLMTLNPIDGGTLNRYLESLSEVADGLDRVKTGVFGSGYDEVTQSEEIIAYREAVYVLSALEGWRFLHYTLKCSIENLAYNSIEEQLNFSKNLLKKDIQKGQEKSNDLLLILERTLAQYCKPSGFEKAVSGDADIDELNRTFGILFEDYRQKEKMSDCSDSRLKGKDTAHLEDRQEERKADHLQSEQTKGDVYRTEKLIGKFMWLCGRIDENRVRSASHEERSRVIGFPLSKLGDMFDGKRQNLVESILYHADRGDGSIVAKSIAGQDAKYFFSVVHEGEQNYMYYVDNYFPILYGFYYIEKEAAESVSADVVMAWKEKVLDIYMQSGEELIFAMDREDLLSIQVSRDYKSILVQKMWEYSDDEELGKVLNIAKKVIQEQTANCVKTGNK